MSTMRWAIVRDMVSRSNQMHFACCRIELVAESRVGDRDQTKRTFSRRLASDLTHAVLGHDILGVDVGGRRRPLNPRHNAPCLAVRPCRPVRHLSYTGVPTAAA